MIQKSIIAITLTLTCLSTTAAPTLPFIGSRNFQLTEGNASSQQITIKANGQTTIMTQGMIKPYVVYKGVYKLIMVDKEDARYKIVGKFIYSLDRNNQVLHDCYRMSEEVLCKAELYQE
jgi:hypothetical protein